nr:hypothetical protein [Bartonella harrusi]
MDLPIYSFTGAVVKWVWVRFKKGFFKKYRELATQWRFILHEKS